jgi:ankyrin repeat protein
MDAKTIKRYTALMIASQYGHTATVNALLRADAEIDAKDGNGYTSLMLAESFKHSAVVEVLTKY